MNLPDEASLLNGPLVSRLTVDLHQATICFGVLRCPHSRKRLCAAPDTQHRLTKAADKMI